MGKFGDKIKRRIEEVCKEKGLTARELAPKMGIKPPYLSEIINRGKLPSPKVLFKIEKVLDIDLRAEYYNEKFSDQEKTIATTGSTTAIKVADESLTRDLTNTLLSIQAYSKDPQRGEENIVEHLSRLKKKIEILIKKKS